MLTKIVTTAIAVVFLAGGTSAFRETCYYSDEACTTKVQCMTMAEEEVIQKQEDDAMGLQLVETCLGIGQPQLEYCQADCSSAVNKSSKSYSTSSKSYSTGDTKVGDTTISQWSMSWSAGDKLTIGCTDWGDCTGAGVEQAVVKSVTRNSKGEHVVTFTTALKNAHVAGSDITFEGVDVDCKDFCLHQNAEAFTSCMSGIDFDPRYVFTAEGLASMKAAKSSKTVPVSAKGLVVAAVQSDDDDEYSDLTSCESYLDVYNAQVKESNLLNELSPFMAEKTLTMSEFEMCTDDTKSNCEDSCENQEGATSFGYDGYDFIFTTTAVCKAKCVAKCAECDNVPEWSGFATWEAYEKADSAGQWVGGPRPTKQETITRCKTDGMYCKREPKLPGSTTTVYKSFKNVCAGTTTKGDGIVMKTSKSSKKIPANAKSVEMDDVTGITKGTVLNFGAGQKAETGTVVSVEKSRRSRRAVTPGTVTLKEALKNEHAAGTTITWTLAAVTKASAVTTTVGVGIFAIVAALF